MPKVSMNCDRVLITGCGGMLGNAAYPSFKSKYTHVLATDKDITEDWLERLDVRDDARLVRVFWEYSPDIVLHLAAETDLEYCETHEEIAEDTNSRATETIARLCRQYDSTLVYISTAGVFDGKKDGLYTEEDQPLPIMVYGRTKYAGERLVKEHCPKSYVIRAGWMMGGGRNKEKKFIYKILKQIEAGQKNIYAVDDLWGTPTYTHDFTMNLLALLNTECYGIYHMVCEGSGTRYDVAKEILTICRRSEINLTPVTSDFFREKYFVRRPRSEMMTNANLRKIGCHHMRMWKIALREYIEHSFVDFIAQPARTLIADSNALRAQLPERRLQARKLVSLPIKFSLDGKKLSFIYSGSLIDANVEGFGLLSEQLLNEGSIITIQSTKGEKHIPSAEVRWVVPIEQKYRVGLKYIDNRFQTAHFLPGHELAPAGGRVTTR